MDSARIAALLAPFLDTSLAESVLHDISTYIDLILHWNTRVNLTAVRDPENIVTRHLGESFFLARHLFLREAHVGPNAPVRAAGQSPAVRNTFPHTDTLLPSPYPPVKGHQSGGALEDGPPLCSAQGSEPRLSAAPPLRSLQEGDSISSLCALDIGSGAGFPALPLKLWAPRIHLTLIESNHKKAAFLREVIRALTLTDVNVITERAETLASRPDFPHADLVTFRAVERFTDVLPLAQNLLAPNGRLALLIGSKQVESLNALAPAVQWQPPIPVPSSRERILAIGTKSVTSGNSP